MGGAANAQCNKCGGPVSKQAKTGICRKCFVKAPFDYIRAHNPDFEQKRIEALRLAYRANPEWQEKIRAHCKNLSALPHIRAARSEKAKAQRLHDLGFPGTQTEEAKRKMVRTRADRTLGWCPAHLRDEYRRLKVRHKMLAADARAIILEQHEADMRRFRAKLGVTGEVPDPRVPFFPDYGNDNIEPGTMVRAEVHKAEKARIEAIRLHRTLCRICGARTDIGCEHGAAA